MSLNLIENLFNPNIHVKCGNSGYATKNNLLHYMASRKNNRDDSILSFDYMFYHKKKLMEKIV